MSEDSYRLLNFILASVSFASSLIFFIAVVYRDSLAKKYIGPKIRLVTRDIPEGELTYVGPNRIPAKYWHLQASNDRPHIQATSVELLLTSFSIGTEGHEIAQLMPGPLPIKTRGELGPATLGYKDITFDFCKFVEDQGIEIMLEGGKIPNNLQHRLTKPGSFTATLQAKGDNAESTKIFIKLSWDGETKITSLKPHSISFTIRST